MDENSPQMVLIEQGLNDSVDTLLVGFMIYVPPASHSVSLKGQHWHDDPLQGHESDVQS